MTDRATNINRLYEGLTFVSRQSRELGAQLHPELSLVAHSLLSFIDAEPDARAADVAAAYGLDKSTVSRQLSQLETAGLLVRTEERPGRRGHVLELTNAGRQVLKRAAESSRKTLATHLTDWQDEDVEALAALLARFAETSRRARHSIA
ncbi:MAG: MarR family winged helix-turn-helix transcriptional regulator [Actinomycetota bacterium]|nr:MarR family winged helix-turn-helix transcriptional regulator [Actinomycetota bacterium]